MSSKLKKLGVLADIYQSESLDGTITRLQLEQVRPSADQPRKDRMSGVQELAASIKQDGLLSPIVVTRDGKGYRIIAGERRYHAIKSLGWTDAECRIISREERDFWRISIIENLQREDLSSEDEASALFKLKQQENYSDADLARMVGKSRNYITEILGIASLPQDVLDSCNQAGIDSKNLLIQVVQAYKKGNFELFLDAYRQGNIRTVRAARDFVQKRSQSIEDPAKSTSKKVSAGSSIAGAVQISTKGKTIQIECSTASRAQKLATLLKVQLIENKLL